MVHAKLRAGARLFVVLSAAGSVAGGVSIYVDCPARLLCSCSDRRCGPCPAGSHCIELGGGLHNKTAACCPATPAGYKCGTPWDVSKAGFKVGTRVIVIKMDTEATVATPVLSSGKNKGLQQVKYDDGTTYHVPPSGMKAVNGPNNEGKMKMLCCQRNLLDDRQSARLCGSGPHMRCCGPGTHGQQHSCGNRLGTRASDCCVNRALDLEQQAAQYHCCVNDVGVHCPSLQRHDTPRDCCTLPVVGFQPYPAHHPCQYRNRSDGGNDTRTCERRYRATATQTLTATLPPAAAPGGAAPSDDPARRDTAWFHPDGLPGVVVGVALLLVGTCVLPLAMHQCKRALKGCRRDVVERESLLGDAPETLPFVDELPETVGAEEYRSTMGVAVHFAQRGVEGQRRGTCLVLGDPTVIAGHCSTTSHNDFAGARVLVTSVQGGEIVRRHLPHDGFTVVDGQGGVVHANGRIVAKLWEHDLPPGLEGTGSRARAAAGLCSCCPCVCVIVSEDSRGEVWVLCTDAQRPDGVPRAERVAPVPRPAHVRGQRGRQAARPATPC